MRLVTAGKSNAEIADLLGIRDKAVSTYRTRILDKLRLRTIAELVRYAWNTRSSTDRDVSGFSDTHTSLSPIPRTAATGYQ